MRLRTPSILALLLSASVPVLAQSQTAPARPPEPRAEAEPEHIKVQHILIAYRGSVPGKEIQRSRAEAGELAQQVFQEAKGGADFDALVKEYTDDAYPGIYAMSNFGVTPGEGEYPRSRMVAAFGDVGFKLAVGEIGIAEWNPGKNAQGQAISPYGWHIIKRIE